MTEPFEPMINEMRPTDYWQVLTRRRWVVLSFFVIFLSTVTVGTFLATPLYRAEVKIIIEGESTNVLAAEQSTSSGTNLDIYENYLETQMALIKSDSVAGKVFNEMALGDTPRYRKREGVAAVFAPKFVNDIYLKRLPGTRMIQLGLENPDPVRAAEIADRLAVIYVQDNLMRRALTFIRNQRMASLNSEFLRLQSKYDSLSTLYGPKHPDMITLKQEISAMSQRIESENTSGLGTPNQSAGVQERALLEATLLKIQEGSVFSSSRMSNVAIVDKAITPERISKPKRALNIVIGIVLGLIGGIFFAFFIDYLDDVIKTDDDLKRKLAGGIFLGSLMAEKGVSGHDAAVSHIERLVEAKPESPSAEAYRLVRTRILWSLSKEEALKTMAVISSVPGEGKTTVASNLAIAFAQLKMKILLVDTDVRRGRIHETYDLPNDKGLANYLAENVPFDTVVQSSAVDSLSIVSCGKSPIDPSQLLSSHKMAEFIKHAKDQFDMVIFDTPPIMVISDASILLRQLQRALLTVRCGYTGTRILSKALSIIQESRTRLIGVVLNDADFSEARAYRHYYHAYQHKT